MAESSLAPNGVGGPFLDACKGGTPSHIPVWLMRQAGRYMSEYRELRSKVSFMELCHTPELACEVTVHAATVLNTDAAILFADILLILELFGTKVSLLKHKGPQIEPPLRDPAKIDKLPEPDLDGLNAVYKAVSLIRNELPKDKALIGFAGAPFTVASYLIEGGPSKNFENTKKMMFGAPEKFTALMEKIGRATGEYLRRQVEAGADAPYETGKHGGARMGDSAPLRVAADPGEAAGLHGLQLCCPPECSGPPGHRVAP